MKILKFLKTRIIDHWQTSVAAILVLAGIIWFHTGRIDFADFKEYVIFIPSVILLLMKDWKKDGTNG